MAQARCITFFQATTTGSGGIIGLYKRKVFDSSSPAAFGVPKYTID